jgi:protein kinase X
LLFEFAPGGELFSYLRASGRFGNRMSRFYAAEIVTALDYMHGRNVVRSRVRTRVLVLNMIRFRSIVI